MDRKINPWSIDIDDEHKEFALTSAALGSKMWSEPGFGVRVDDIMEWAYSDGGMTPDGSFRVVPLSRMLSEQSEGDVQRCLNTFRADSALSFDVKLRKDAIGFERSDRCRTYLIMTPSDDILGYLMLGLGNLNVPEGNCLSIYIFCRNLSACCSKSNFSTRVTERYPHSFWHSCPGPSTVPMGSRTCSSRWHITS